MQRLRTLLLPFAPIVAIALLVSISSQARPALAQSPVAELRGDKQGVASLAYSPDGKNLAAGGFDRKVRVWSQPARTGAAPELTIAGPRSPVLALAFSTDGATLFTAGEPAGPAPQGMNEHGGFPPLGGPEVPIWGNPTDTIRAWNVASGAPAAGPKTPVLPGVLAGERFLSIVAFPDGKSLAAGGSKGSVLVWDIAERRVTLRFAGHARAVSGVAISPDGKTVASGSWDGMITFWDAQTGAARPNLRGHMGWVTAVAFSPDGQMLASCGWDGTARLWDVASGEQLVAMTGHDGPVRCLAFSPDGETLVTGGIDQTIQVYDVVRGRSVAVLVGHHDVVNAVAFSPDGKTLASSSQAGGVKLWDAATIVEAGKRILPEDPFR